MNKAKVSRWVILILISGILVGFGFISLGNKYFKIAQQLDIFSRVYKEVNRSYVDNVDPTLLMRKAIDSMMSTLDPYTVFISESRIEDAKFIRTGQYSGVGARISRMKDQIVVRSIVQNGPSDIADIRPGDILRSIDGEDITDSTWPLSKIDNLLQGEQGSVVTLRLQREDRILDVDVTRDFVEALQSSVPYYGLTHDMIGYVKLTVFNESAAPDLEAAVRSLEKNHPELEGIILDLRDNPGGRVDQAIDILNLFLPKDETVLDMKGRSPMHTRSFSTRRDPWNTDIPLAILIDEGSASASEIVAGAIQDFDRGILVGQKSFGKGLVQNVRPLSYNTQFKITVAKYYTPSGRCIQAIDYSNKDLSGGVDSIPDSLKKAFTTRNVRKVYDGAGIDPDIPVDLAKKSTILQALISQGMIFDFATLFVRENDSIAPPASFQISDELYQQFLDFLAENKFEYSTPSEQSIDEFQALLESEEGLDELDLPLNKISQQIISYKADDLEQYKKDIIEELKEEILRRYYYEAGITEASFFNDPVVVKAAQSLLDTEMYNDQLNNK